MNDPGAARLARLGRVVSGVVRQTVVDAAAAGILLRPDGCESDLARDWCIAAIGPGLIFAESGGPRLLMAHGASKTTLLLTEVSRAALFPIGDLYGSELQSLTGRWTPPREVEELVALAGGAARLDAALRRWAEERRPLESALAGLPADAAAAVARAVASSRFSRQLAGIVPKLTVRTVGVDLWE